MGGRLNTVTVTRLLLLASKTFPCLFPPAIFPLLPPPCLQLSLLHTVVYGTPVWRDICLLLSLSSGFLVELASHKSKQVLISSSDHFCSFLFLPELDSLLTPILLPSLPHLSCLGGRGFPFFCLATAIGTVTHLKITHLGRSTLTHLLFTFKKAAYKGPFCWLWLIWADTSQMVCFLAFLAAYPHCNVNTIDVNNTISNMLQFKPHLVLCFNRAYEAFPTIYLDTFSMLIWVQFHRMCHSKEENSKRVG